MEPVGDAGHVLLGLTGGFHRSTQLHNGYPTPHYLLLCGVVVFVEAQQWDYNSPRPYGGKEVFPLLVQTRPYRRGKIV